MGTETPTRGAHAAWWGVVHSTLIDLAPDHIRAYARPKAPTHLIPGRFRDQDGAWPVEFRVFVVGGRVVGVSNYYPQVVLDRTDWAGAARTSIALAERMIATMEDLHLGVGNHRLCADSGDEDRRSDWMPPAWGPQDFTLDFLFDVERGEMIFLEGGPAGLQAAHPCCFAPCRDHPVNALSGAIFAEGSDPIPLTEL